MYKSVACCDICKDEISSTNDMVHLTYRHSYYDEAVGSRHSGYVGRDVCFSCARKAIKAQYPQLEPKD